MHAWVPTVNEVLRVEREMSNPHDVYAVAVKKRLPGFRSESFAKRSVQDHSLSSWWKVSCRVTDIRDHH